jgi:hypothetical protein
VDCAGGRLSLRRTVDKDLEPAPATSRAGLKTDPAALVKPRRSHVGMFETPARSVRVSTHCNALDAGFQRDAFGSLRAGDRAAVEGARTDFMSLDE